MKKIYLSIATLAIYGSTFAQFLPKAATRNNLESHKSNISHPSKSRSNMAARPTTGPGNFVAFFGDEAIEFYQYTEGTQYDFYLNTIFMDSTAANSDADGLSYVSNIKAGVNFDPVSILWGQGNQVLSSADAYTVDSLLIGGIYRRINHSVVDTLLIECVWGPRNSSTVWTPLSITSSTPALTTIGAKVNSSTAQGNVSFLTAPATNYKRIKYALTDADTGRTNADYYKIIKGINVNVPAGNVFSMAYTFIPGQAVTPGSVVWQYQGGVAQTTNGWAGGLYSDPSLNPTGNYFYDPTSRSLGVDYYKFQRYATLTGGSAFLNNCLFTNVDAAWDIGVAVSYTNSTVSVNELDKKGFILGQNTPNPYKGESKVSYMLSKNVSSAVFTITDVMGRVISSENVNTNQGTHSVKLGALTSGIYYYTLNVDGNTTTNKMIVE